MRTNEDPGVVRTCEGFSHMTDAEEYEYEKARGDFGPEDIVDVVDLVPGMIIKTHPASSLKAVQSVRQSGEYMVIDLISVYGKNSVASIKIGGTLELWSE